jgi:TonB family protein
MEDWQNQLQAIGAALIDGKFVAAEQASAGLADVMADQIVGGVGADLLFGITTAYRAAALVGQGRIEQGVWHWQVAQQLFPQVAEIDLARFGPDAAILAEHPPRVPRAENANSGSGSGGAFVPPRRVESPLPRFPSGRALRGLKVDVVVQVVVGVDGRPREPVILDSRGEVTLVYSALDALSRWVFEPGRRDGVAEPALYKLTVTFVVPDA